MTRYPSCRPRIHLPTPRGPVGGTGLALKLIAQQHFRAQPTPVRQSATVSAADCQRCLKWSRAAFDGTTAEAATSTGTRPSKPAALYPTYTLAEMRAVVAQALSVGTWPYCAGPPTVASFSIDHHNLISRHGDFSIGNTIVCHLRCNKIKGNLTSHEFLYLIAFLAHFPPEVGKDVLARLYAAGRVMRRR